MPIRITGRYNGMDATALAALIVQLEAAQTAIIGGFQAYSRPGFSFTRANLDQIGEMLAEAYYSRDLRSGALVNKQVVDLSV